MSETNPVDSYLQSKEASATQQAFGFMGGAGAKFMAGAKKAISPEMLGQAAAGSAVVAGGAMLASAAGKVMGAITKKRDFDAMMEHAPDLKEYQAQDPALFNRHYNSLRSMNPQFAKDPVVAAGYMRQMSEYPATAGNTIVQSLSALPKQQRGVDLKVGRDGSHISFKG